MISWGVEHNYFRTIYHAWKLAPSFYLRHYSSMWELFFNAKHQRFFFVLCSRPLGPRAQCPIISFVLFMHGRCFNLWPKSLCCCKAHTNIVLPQCAHYLFLLSISLFFFPVGLFFRVGIHRKGLVGRWCILLCLFDVLFDDFYSLVIRFGPRPGVLSSLLFSSCTGDVLLANTLVLSHRHTTSCCAHIWPLLVLTAYLCDFFLVVLFFRVGSRRKGLVGRQLILLCLSNVLFDDLYSLVILFRFFPFCLLIWLCKSFRGRTFLCPCCLCFILLGLLAGDGWPCRGWMTL